MAGAALDDEAAADAAVPAAAHADVVKGVHARLRLEVQEALQAARSRKSSPLTDDEQAQVEREVWSSHLQRTACLKEYARAMDLLAVQVWERGAACAPALEGNARCTVGSDVVENRYDWVQSACECWFFGDSSSPSGLEVVLAKEARARRFQQESNETGADNSAGGVDAVAEEGPQWVKPLKLLDVGSNNNFLGRHCERFGGLFDVTAMDIAPAHESVVCADFLELPIAEEGSRAGSAWRPASFDVVLFSLLLSYMPSTRMRYECCRQARRVLKRHGLLIIFDPDSRSHTRSVQWMRDWRVAIEGLGFKRWRYRKALHMHCLAFRAVDEAAPGAGDVDHALMRIPQDSAA